MVPLVNAALLLLKVTVFVEPGLKPAVEVLPDVRSQFVLAPLRADQLAFTLPRQ